MELAPVLITCFNRPELMRDLLNSILNNKVSKLYFWIDGPRNNYDTFKIQECVDLIRKMEFKCNVEIMRNSENLGVYKSIKGAVDWVFEKEDKCIIIEDDLIVDAKFFDFINLALGEIEHDSEINSVTGCSLVPVKITNLNETCYKSIYFESWGWATWKSKWNEIDFEMDSWQETLDKLDNLEEYKNIDLKYWRNIFSLVDSGHIDSWAYRVMHNNFKNNKFTLVPYSNYIFNQGFGRYATNTKFSKAKFRQNNSVNQILIKFQKNVDAESDMWMTLNHFNYTFRRKLHSKFVRFKHMLKEA